MSEIELFAENELTPVESEEREFHEGVVDDVKGGIEKLASIGDASLKVLRDKRLYRTSHKTFEDYCQERFGIVRTTANRGIAFAGVLENLMPRGIKSLPTTEYQARPLTALPTPDIQAQAWEQAQADSGKDQPSNREVAEAVAKVQAIEAELATEKRRNMEWATQSTSQKQHIEALEHRIDLFDAQPKLEPIIKVVEKIPADYDVIKAKAAQLETELATNKAEQTRIIQSAIKAKLSGYQGEVDALEAKKRNLEQQAMEYQDYLASLTGKAKQMESQARAFEKTRQALVDLASELADFQPVDKDLTRKALALAEMHDAAAQSLRLVFGQGLKEFPQSITPSSH